jgi:predicted metal-dependent hydrolase
VALPVEIIRSARRRKTVSAELVGGVVRVLVPSWMDAPDVDRHVAELVPRLERRFRSSHVDLPARAAELARRYDLPQPTAVVWAENQRRQWGSCNVGTGEIRLSIRLADYPSWVLDYVLVHELAHLVHADHSPAFKALVGRYRLAERARGFLMAKDDAPVACAPPGDQAESVAINEVRSEPGPVPRAAHRPARRQLADQLELGI